MNKSPKDRFDGDVPLSSIIEFVETTSTIPTETPDSFTEQFIIYKNGSTRRFYWYDTQNNEWVYASGTV